jgi:hypothetical protein
VWNFDCWASGGALGLRRMATAGRTRTARPPQGEFSPCAGLLEAVKGSKYHSLGRHRRCTGLFIACRIAEIYFSMVGEAISRDLDSVQSSLMGVRL